MEPSNKTKIPEKLLTEIQSIFFLHVLLENDLLWIGSDNPDYDKFKNEEDCFTILREFKSHFDKLNGQSKEIFNGIAIQLAYTKHLETTSPNVFNDDSKDGIHNSFEGLILLRHPIYEKNLRKDEYDYEKQKIQFCPFHTTQNSMHILFHECVHAFSDNCMRLNITEKIIIPFLQSHKIFKKFIKNVSKFIDEDFAERYPPSFFINEINNFATKTNIIG